MKKIDYVRAIAKKCGHSQQVIADVLKAQGEVVAETFTEEQVPLVTGITLQTCERAARTCRNPRTGEKIDVPAHIAPKVTVGKKFKDICKELEVDI